MVTKDLETPVAKISLEDIASGYASTALLNDNFELIADALNNDVLYRDNPVGEANQMSNQLDMNSNRITNLGDAILASDAVNFRQLTSVTASGGSIDAEFVTYTPADTEYPSTNVKGRLDSLAASGGSDLIGYDDRTVQDRLNDFSEVSLLQFSHLAVGDDWSAALVAFFASIPTSSDDDFSDVRAAYTSKHYVIPPGVYKTTVPLILGSATEYIINLNLEMRGSVIYGLDLVDDFTLTITNSVQCNYDLSITAENSNGLKFDTARNCTLPRIAAASDRDYSLYTCGVMFQLNWGAVLLSQNNSRNGATYGWLADHSVNTQTTYTGMAINNIDLLAFAGCDNGFHLIGNNALASNNIGAINIGTVECEGTTLVAMRFYQCKEAVNINSIWAESGSTTYWLDIDGCESVAIGNVKGPGTSDARPIRLKDTSSFDLKNTNGIDQLEIVGTVGKIMLDNVEFLASASRVIFNPLGTQYTRVNSWSVRNLSVVSLADALVYRCGGFQSGSLSPANNVILNPKGRDADGSVTTTHCSVVADAGYTAVSPLGFQESILEVTASTSYPIIVLSLDTTKLIQNSGVYTLITAFKHQGIVGGVEITSCGAQDITCIYGRFYGDLHFIDGDWLISVTQLLVPSTATTVSVIFNYNASQTVGHKFSFGGALLVPGANPQLP